MIEQLSVYLTSMILGIMLFFSFVIAPVVFTTLDENNARKFIRRIFPFYYNVNLGISFIVLLVLYDTPEGVLRKDHSPRKTYNENIFFHDFRVRFEIK